MNINDIVKKNIPVLIRNLKIIIILFIDYKIFKNKNQK